MSIGTQSPAAHLMAACLGLILLAICGAVGMILPAVFGAEPTRLLVQEHSTLETASAIMWFVLAAALFIYAAGADRILWVFAVLAVAAGARELDVHTQLTTRSISQMSYWVDGSVPPGEKLVAGAIVSLVAATAAYGLVRRGKSVVSALRRGNSAAWNLASLTLAIPVTKIVDLIPHYVPGPRATEVGASYLILAAGAFEEMAEMMMPVIGVLALGQHSEHRKSNPQFGTRNSSAARMDGG
jgi:hypothetical protein